MEALKELGYSGAEALKAVKKVKDADTMKTEEIIRNALRQM